MRPRRPAAAAAALALLLLAMAAAVAPAGASPEEDFIASFMRPLRGLTMKCVRYTAEGDGFIRFKDPEETQKACVGAGMHGGSSLGGRCWTCGLPPGRS
jgi:hypothetical protein